MEVGKLRRWSAGLIDLAVPVACLALAWPVVVYISVVASFALGFHVGLLYIGLLVLVLLVGVIMNEFAFPMARGWTVGMVFTRLRLVRSSVRGRGLLLRSLLTWVTAPAIYFGAEFARWEILTAIGMRPRLYSGLIPASPVATLVVVGWVLVLTYPFRGHPLLDRVAGWQVTHRDARPVESGPRKRAGLPLWAWVLTTLTGVVVVVVLAFSALVVVISIQDPGTVARVESDLRNAATALEVYHHEEGRYAEEALESRVWGYHGDVEVELEVYISSDGQSFCLEGFHFDRSDRVATYDSDDGLDREASCRS